MRVKQKIEYLYGYVYASVINKSYTKNCGEEFISINGL